MDDEAKLRVTISDIIDEMADYVNRLDDESSASIYHEAKGDLDYTIFKLAKLIANKNTKK